MGTRDTFFGGRSGTAGFCRADALTGVAFGLDAGVVAGFSGIFSGALDIGLIVRLVVDFAAALGGVFKATVVTFSKLFSFAAEVFSALGLLLVFDGMTFFPYDKKTVYTQDIIDGC
ncbi:hypothetical protein [Polaromonas vacuolata]|uniref:hypothetical protein n=1 Tax=Polaromonas vacuolata TaxID=37448 RepID=UPI001EE26EBC|nr:hypothetical protein [Polaromonas vacuolata]